MPSQRTPTERFFASVEFTDSCWLWHGRTSDHGYGRFYTGGRYLPAHRWTYQFCVGLVPDDLTIDHLCRVRLCVRPDHIEVVPMRVNVLRGLGPKRPERQKKCLSQRSRVYRREHKT